MRIEVDGQHYDVPDDATNDEIDAITKPAPAPSKTESFLRGGAQGATFGFGDEAQGLIQAAGQKLLPDSLGGGDYGKSFGDLYRESRDTMRRENDAAQEANPKMFLAGNVAGGLATSALGEARLAGAAARGLGIARAAPGAGVLLRALQAAKSGAVLGGAAGLGSSKADLTEGDVVGALGDASKGAAGGAAISGALPVAGAILRRALGGVVQPTVEARALMAQGVPLTLGQSSPRSFFNGIEQAAESTPGLGETIASQRQAARAGWQTAALNEVRPPGAAARTGLDVPDHFDALLNDFDQAYSPIRGQAVQPITSTGQPLEQAIAAAADDQRVLANQDTREAVRGFLDNAVTQLPPANTPAQQALLAQLAQQGITGQRAQQMAAQLAPGVPRALNAGDLISLRSSIRAEIRQAALGANPDYKTAALLRNAEQAVTDSLNSQLPNSGLAAIDRQYGKLMQVSSAIRKAGDMPNGFTPAQLSQAVRSATPSRAYAAGGGGPLRDLAAAGRATMDATIPPTGARLAKLAANVPVVRYLPTAIAALGTTGVGRRLLTGATAPQLAAQHLGGSLLVRALAARAAPVLAEQAGENSQ